MKIVFLSKFYKDLGKIKDKNTRERLLKIIEEIESANSLLDINNIKKLSGDKISYRIRLGDYRLGIFYEKIQLNLFALFTEKIYIKFFHKAV